MSNFEWVIFGALSLFVLMGLLGPLIYKKPIKKVNYPPPEGAGWVEIRAKRLGQIPCIREAQAWQPLSRRWRSLKLWRSRAWVRDDRGDEIFAWVGQLMGAYPIGCQLLYIQVGIAISNESTVIESKPMSRFTGRSLMIWNDLDR